MFTGIAAAAMLAKKKEEPIFECPVCDVQFNRRYNRNRHMELIHKMSRPDLPPLIPDVVKKLPEESQKLKESQQVSESTMETAISPVPTKVIEENESKPMKVDEMKKEEPVFECPICDGQFNRKYNRDRHMELIHKMPRPDLPPLFPDVVKKHPEESQKLKESQKSKESHQVSESIMETGISPVPANVIEEESRSTKVCPQSGRTIKKVKMGPEPKKNEDVAMETGTSSQTEPQVMQLPIQNILTGRTMTSGLTVHF
ncbi:MAG: hypothetical protein GY795_10415, partial [Desulfobacterales bacterium]|nr:hypothetical protein [Desulfobacterales bacterium]